MWLLKLGLRVIHARPYHPQTLGKDERFHRTLKAEVLQYCQSWDLAGCQRRFESWRLNYNLERPHEVLGLAPPVSRYRASPRIFPERLPQWDYGPADQVRRVQAEGWFSFRGREYRLSKALRGEQVALRPTLTDGVWDVFFGPHRLAGLMRKNLLRMTNVRFSLSSQIRQLSSRLSGVKAALRLGPGLDPRSAPADQQGSGRKEKMCEFVGPLNPKSVTYVSEHLLPFSPVQTMGEG